LEQVNKVFPINELIDEEEWDRVALEKNAPEVVKLDKYLWRIRILGSREVSRNAWQLQSSYFRALRELKKGNSDKAFKETLKAQENLSVLVLAMAGEIQGSPLRRFFKY
jgi:hypothetical protein